MSQEIKIRITGDSTQFVQASKTAQAELGAFGKTADGARASMAGIDAAGATTSRRLAEVGMSAKATAAAMRTVPAQLQDMAVSLQGGQSFATVMLQQGSQLATSFGGVGNALKATAGYAVGLINPFTLAAAAAGGLALAYEKGASELREFDKATILSNGSFGVTANQLSEIAARVKEVGDSTRGRASEALLEIAGAGVRGADALQRVTAAAVEYERVGGGAAKTVGENYARLGKEPLKASMALNEAMNYLTRSTFEQIRVLEEQGRTVDAARIAQDAYLTAVEDSTPQLLKSLGLVESAWLRIKGASSKAIDAVLNVGREMSLSEGIADKRGQIDAIQGLIQSGAGGAETVARRQNLLQIRQQELSYLTENLRLEQKVADIKTEQAASVKAAASWTSAISSYLPKEVQLTKELTELRNKASAAQRGATPEQSSKIAKELANAEAEARKKFSDKGGVADINRGIDAEVEALKAGSAIKAEIYRQEADTRSSELKRGVINELQYIEQERDAKLAALADSRAILEKELALIKTKAGGQKELATVAGQIALNEQQAATVTIKAQNDVLDVKFKQVQASDAVIRAQQEETAGELAAAAVASAQERSKGIAAVRGYAAAIKDSIAATQLEMSLVGQSDAFSQREIEQLKIKIDLRNQLAAINSNPGFDAADRERASAEASAAAALASANLVDKIYVDQWKRTSATIEQSLTDALMRGFESGKGFGDNLKQTFKNLSKTLIIKPLIEMPVKQVAAGISELTNKFAEFVAVQVLGHQQVATSAEIAAQTEVTAAAAAGMADAPVAVLNQAKGDPYTAFARMAAMAVAVAGLGFAVSGGFSGGGAVPPPTNQGVGTVFGAVDAKSASIENSINLLAETSTEGLRYSAQMAASLRNIEASMVGVTSLLLRGGNLDGLTEGVQFGQLSKPNLGSTDWRSVASISLDPISALTGKNNLFGKKSTLLGTGIMGGPQTLGDIESLGFQGNYYADIESKSKFLGITTSRKTSTTLEKLDAEMARQFSLIFDGIGDTVSAAAGGLGLDLDAISQRLSGFVVDIGKVDLKDLSGEQIQEKLAAVFGAEADKIASSVIPGFEAIQRVGEGYFETLTRAAHQLEVVDTAFERMNRTLGGTYIAGTTAAADAQLLAEGRAPGVQRAINADEVVQQFGGLEDFVSATDEYYQAFTSSAKQNTDTLSLITRSLDGQGLTLPKTQAQWDALTRTLDLNTDAGLEAFEVMVRLGPTFKDTLDAMLSDAGIGVDSLATMVRDGMIGRISQEDLGAKMADTVIGGIYNSLYAGVSQQIAQAFTDQIILPMLTSVTTGGAISAAVSQETIDNVVQQATRSMEAIAAVANNANFQAAMAGVQSAISGIVGAVAQPAAIAAPAYQSLGNSVGYASSAASSGVNAWKSIGDSLTDEINRIRGVLAGKGASGEAFAQSRLAVLTAQARAGSEEAAQQLPKANQDYLAMAEQNSSSELQLRLKQAWSLDSLVKTRGIVAEKFGISLPSFDVGTNYVPRDMVAQLHEGESVVPKAYNPAANGRANADLSREVAALRQQVQQLLGQLVQHAKNTDESTAITARALDQNIKGGPPVRVKVVT